MASLIPRFPRRYAVNSDRIPEEKPECSLFSRCKGCPYPSHGFICWSRDGQCMREFMKKLCKGDDEE